jgi:UDP-glucose 4-epimerase
MKLLITGASGFLGAAFGEAAAAAGHEIVGIGRNAQKPLHWPGEYRRADFDSPFALERLIRETAPECVAHFAGTASVGESFQTPAGDFENSTGLWFRLLDAIRRSDSRPLVALASSAAVYGSPEMLPTPEAAPRAPESPYGFHKLLSEQVAEEFAHCFGFSIVSLRFFSVFGAGQRRLLVWEIFEQLRRGMPTVRLKGTGDERRDFLSSAEAAAAAAGVLAACVGQEAGFWPVNIASGASVSVREVAETLRTCAGSEAEFVFGREELRGNPAHWQADVGRLQQLLPDWRPASFPKSLAACVQSWKSGSAEPALQPVN